METIEQDGLLYTVTWPYNNPEDLKKYLNKQKDPDEHIRKSYNMIGHDVIRVETQERKARAIFRLRKFKMPSQLRTRQSRHRW